MLKMNLHEKLINWISICLENLGAPMNGERVGKSGRGHRHGHIVTLPYYCVKKNALPFLKEWKGDEISMVSKCIEELHSSHTFYLLRFFIYFLAWWQSRKPKHWKIFSKHSIEPPTKLLMRRSLRFILIRNDQTG